MGFYCRGCANLFDENQQLRGACRVLMAALESFKQPTGECGNCNLPFVKTRRTQKFCQEVSCKREAQRLYARNWWRKHNQKEVA